MNSTIVNNSTPYKPEDYLETSQDIQAYIEDCIEEDDPALLIVAAGVIDRAKGAALLEKLPTRTNDI